ncbi:plasmid stability protein [Lelliottia amnigena]|uniref:Plasmid stability protein n=1 Tax=Lelliottia amnigena TaxID=61646 RepID=A0AAP2F1G0_LELAM|nr:plasmid partitioning/stability family protein [Lelliottia amnigena]MBL5901170.1 plasmid stability protein [Lelliottia amnigena]MBL5936988.1 plasmid stability protein [Lelliottia amnigena]
MPKSDKRRKITFYLNPEGSAADRYACDAIERMPQGDRGGFWRAALLAGFALGKQDDRLPHMLAAQLTEYSTFEEMVLVMKAVFPEAMSSFGERRTAEPAAVRIVSEMKEENGEDETLKNARAMFGGNP